MLGSEATRAALVRQEEAVSDDVEANGLWIVVGFIVLMLAALIFSTSWAWF